MRTSIWGVCFIFAALLLPWPARAQEPLPPLPPPGNEPAPAPATPSALPPPAAPPTAAVAQPPKQYAYLPPPRGAAGYSAAERTHAPIYSLWLGGSLGLLGYSGGLYINDLTPPAGNSGVETTGNFFRPGVALQADVGARLGRRYIPYVALELGLMGAGRRFDGISTNASTSFVGLGFRYLAGDVDSVTFASDISFGFRKFQVSNASGTWSAGGIEIFRLGFGAEIRLSTLATLSPMLTVSGGTLTETSGSIEFGQPIGDTPLFTGNSGIPPANQETYFAVVLGCGVHLDLFGR